MLPVRLPQRFTVVRELGRGGMGVVYEAIDTVGGGRVAIKTLPSHDPRAIARFKREFRALQDIHHPNLVTLRELFYEDGGWAFSMDLVEGGDLLEYLCPAELSADDNAIFDQPTMSLDSLRPPPVAEVRGSMRVSARSKPCGLPQAFTLDEGKLRDAFGQLARGLAALHEAKKIHRDIKPSNIRVRSDAQVVLLDFGLVTDAASARHLTGDIAVLGTPGYMAPEQASGGGVGPEADWYSVGVVLFEVCTQRLPFEGNLFDVMGAKQKRRAPRIRSLVPDAPADLDDLCALLLNRNPAHRPSADIVLERLGPSAQSVPDAGIRDPAVSLAPPFVGRQELLGTLAEAFAKVLGGHPATVLLEGESGIGKSCAARRFLDEVRRGHPETVIVFGRCYENEAVPYNAWDSGLESLASYWTSLDPADAAALLPTQAAALVQTFPALHRVPVVARAVAQTNRKLDPREVRTRAFTALRDVFDRLSQQVPLIVFIDDLQWADRDSVSLLGEVLREPAPPPFLFLATVRPLRDFPDIARGLGDALPRAARRCEVRQLPRGDATRLAADLLARTSPELASLAESIASEAGGHALFIAELARHIGTTGGLAKGPLSLTDALWSRVAELTPAAQRVLTVLSLVARPTPQTIALQAASVPPDEVPRTLSALRVGHLTRATRANDEEWLETYHDRVRSAVVERTPTESRPALFERIALAFEGTPHADSSLLADFWGVAGDAERAARHARVAGDRACDALAFDRAADLYALALERPASTDEERHDLRVVLADTLVKAGRGREAAAMYQRALAGAKDDVEAIDLEQKACDQLLRTGSLDAGIALARQLLGRLEVRWPHSIFEAALVLALLRVFLAVRGRRFRARSEFELPRKELARMALCFNLGQRMMMTDAVRALMFHQNHLRLALQAGARRRISIAISHELGLSGFRHRGVSASAHRNLEKRIAIAKALAEGVGEPYTLAYCDFGVGLALVGACRAREGVEYLGRAEKVFREECFGKTAEIRGAQFWAFRGYFYLGEFAKLAETQPRALQEAADRRDVQGTVNFRLGFPHFALLVRDDVDGAETAREEALRAWNDLASGAEDEWGGLTSLVNRALYANDPGPAAVAMEEAWPGLRRSGLRILLPAVRFESSEYRARAHLARALGAAAERSFHLAVAKESSRDVARTNIAYASPMSDLLHAQLAAVVGNEEQTVVLLRRAIVGLVAVELCGYAAIARRALGKLLKGDEGAALLREGEDFLRGQTVKNIPALCLCLAPGFGLLE